MRVEKNIYRVNLIKGNKKKKKQNDKSFYMKYSFLYSHLRFINVEIKKKNSIA